MLLIFDGPNWLPYGDNFINEMLFSSAISVDRTSNIYADMVHVDGTITLNLLTTPFWMLLCVIVHKIIVKPWLYYSPNLGSPFWIIRSFWTNLFLTQFCINVASLVKSNMISGALSYLHLKLNRFHIILIGQGFSSIINSWERSIQNLNFGLIEFELPTWF